MVISSVTLTAVRTDAHDFQVQNTSDVDLEIKVFHFEEIEKVWCPGVVRRGTATNVVDLAHGNRVLVAKDRISGKVVFTQPIEAGHRGMKILLTGTSPNILWDKAYTD